MVFNVHFQGRWAVGLVMLAFWAGCREAANSAGNTVPAAGVVTLNGAPVTNAQITFSPRGQSGKAAFASTDGSGRFTLSTFADGDGAVPGEYDVAITKTVTEGKEWTDEEIAAYTAKHKGAMPPPPKVTYEVPEKYGRATTSELSATVSQEVPNEFKFDLK